LQDECHEPMYVYPPGEHLLFHVRKVSGHVYMRIFASF